MQGGESTRWSFCALMAALAVGCASGPPVRQGAETAAVMSPGDAGAASVAPVVWEEPAQLPNPPVESAEVISTPPQEGLQPLALSLFDAVEMGLSQNPDLIAQRTAEGVSEGMLGVAETYPFNPWVQIQVTPYQKSGDPII